MAKIKNTHKNTNDSLVKKQLSSVTTELIDGVFVFSGPMSISEFATKTKLNAIQLITHFLKQNKMYNLNQILTEEEIAELCFENDFDFQKKVEINESNFMDYIVVEEKEEDLVLKPPVVTVMGHVDHGKTTLIDFIRKSSIVKSEKGGITQHTGAYQVKHKKSFITFLDTPGHEAFTDMRSRGAAITNIVILVVAATDGVMPQTVEAINHAKAASTPIIVFVNKMDIAGANAEKVKAELSKHDIVAEDWGGNNQFILGSALNGNGIKNLFEAILIEAEMLNLRANPNRTATGYVLESKVDKGKGVLATLIIENGTLNKRDFIVAGSNYGKIRTLLNSADEEIEYATPGMPVLISGLNYSPNAGDKFICFLDEKFAKEIASKKAFRDKITKINELNSLKNTTPTNTKNINIILKSDVQGTLDALKYSILKAASDEISISLIHSSVGAITKNDLLLAQTTDSIIYSFNLKIDQKVINEAKVLKIKVVNKNIIYEILENLAIEIKTRVGLKYKSIVSGKALIQKIFFYSKVGNIAGCLATDGYIKSGSEIKLYRKDKFIYSGEIDSLQKGKDAIREIKKGNEFGTHIKNYDDIKEGDVIEFLDKIVIEE